MKVTQEQLRSAMCEVAKKIYESDNPITFFCIPTKPVEFDLKKCKLFMQHLPSILTDGVEKINEFDEIMELMKIDLHSSQAAFKMRAKAEAGHRGYDSFGNRGRLSALDAFESKFFNTLQQLCDDPRVTVYNNNRLEQIVNNINAQNQTRSRTSSPRPTS